MVHAPRPCWELRKQRVRPTLPRGVSAPDAGLPGPIWVGARLPNTALQESPATQPLPAPRPGAPAGVGRGRSPRALQAAREQLRTEPIRAVRAVLDEGRPAKAKRGELCGS